MVYTADIPQATDDPSASQPLLLGNFQSLNTFLSVNHVSLNDADQGKHTFLQMPEQGSAPSTAANELGVYAKEYNSVASLFFRAESSGTSYIMASPPLLATAGYTYVGGLFVQWNTVTATSLNAVSFPVAFGATPFYISFMVTQASAPKATWTRIDASSSTTFTPVITDSKGDPVTRQITYIAIGTPA